LNEHISVSILQNC